MTLRSSNFTIAIAVALLSIAAPALGRERTYYIAADEVSWNYAPAGRDITFGRALPHLLPGQLGWAYQKLLYRRYSDATFRVLTVLPQQDRYLGSIGPILRAEVGDSLVIVFKNNTRVPVDIEPTGVVAPVAVPVPRGAVRTYRWTVPERAGPGPSDLTSVLWIYRSGVHGIAGSTAGLIGPIIVTKRGSARDNGSPVDVDRELVVAFRETDESISELFDENVSNATMNPRRLKKTQPALLTDNLFVSLNGFSYGNMPMISLRRAERVRWYLFSSGSTFDFHAPTWTGQTVVWNGRTVDTIALDVSNRQLADMVPDNPGVWELYCMFNLHVEAGMDARFTVLP
jgi:hypothetical protein